MVKKVLVTGGCGFIGVNFVRLVLDSEEDWEIVNLDKLTYAGNLQSLGNAVDNPRHQFIKGDICDRDHMAALFAQYDFDTVVHFAAESHVDRSITGPADFIQTNVFGTFSLLEAARKNWLGTKDPAEVGSRRFLHVSTDEVYGSLGEKGYFTESTCYDPRSPYSASKASSDHLVRSYFHTYGLPVLITNCSNNYGPFQFPEKLIPLVINNALHGREVPVYGDGGNVRDWLYVQDHCEAIVRVLKKGVVGESYNIGGHNEMPNLAVVELLLEILDRKVGLLPSGQPRRNLVTFVSDRKGHDRRYAIDAGKVSSLLGWTPKMSFDQGMEQTVDWYLNNRPWLESIVNGSYRDYYQKMYSGR